jgi:hypothetical protein
MKDALFRDFDKQTPFLSSLIDAINLNNKLSGPFITAK